MVRQDERGEASSPYAHRVSYGVYRLVGRGAQAAVNIIAWHIGYELRRCFKPLERQAGKALAEFVKRLDLSDRVEMDVNDSIITIHMMNCHVCPKRVGDYEIEGTACPVAGLILGFIAAHKGVHLDPRSVHGTYSEHRRDMRV